MDKIAYIWTVVHFGWSFMLYAIWIGYFPSLAIIGLIACPILTAWALFEWKFREKLERIKDLLQK